MNYIHFSYDVLSSMPLYIQFLTYKLDNFKTHYKCGISIYELGLSPVPYSISGDEVRQIEYFGPESAVIDVYYEGYHESDFKEKYKNFDNHTLNDVFLFMLDTLNYYK